MPITFNKAENIWELTDPSQEEKEALMQGAIFEITEFFGEEVAKEIVNRAARDKLNEIKSGKEIPIEDSEEDQPLFGIKAGHA